MQPLERDRGSPCEQSGIGRGQVARLWPGLLPPALLLTTGSEFILKIYLFLFENQIFHPLVHSSNDCNDQS